MITITDKKDCCGCNACGDVCAQGAITFKTDNEGFWYPEVNKELCSDCGLCERVCPMLHLDALHSYGQHEPMVYGGFHKNLTIRFDSTSGGAFSALANAMYKQGGYVSGAVFNDDWTVSNYISNDRKDLSRLRSSKYVESNAEGLYKKIGKLLIAGEKVLACGSPCQMSALRTYLGKNYDNLLVVDFLCRAVNSPKAYRKYLDMLESQFGGKIVYIKAKNKEHGWRSLARKVVFDNGKVYYGEGHDDHFRRGFHKNYYERPSCYDCKFKGLPRIADISLADFWGIEGIDPAIDGNMGTSMVLVNTDKGMRFFDTVKNKMVLNEFDPQTAFQGNYSVIMGNCCSEPKDYNREQMFSDMDKMSFDEVARKWFPEDRHPICKKRFVKKVFSYALRAVRHPNEFLRYVTWHFNSHVKGSIKVHSNCAMDLRKGAIIDATQGRLDIGIKKNLKSKLETRLFMDDNSRYIITGKRNVMYNSDIQIFKGATLRMGSGNCNSGLQIVCADEITIGDGTNFGRDVWIRDNNGGHNVILTGYTDKAPVHIGDHVWISSNVHIMKGVTIGEGAVIAGNSVVTSNVPAHCMASGNPAKVVADNIVWVR